MSTKDLIRALRDEDYRLSMGIHVDNPAGVIELSDGDLDDVAGAKPSIDWRPCTAYGCNTPIILCVWP